MLCCFYCFYIQYVYHAHYIFIFFYSIKELYLDPQFITDIVLFEKLNPYPFLLGDHTLKTPLAKCKSSLFVLEGLCLLQHSLTYNYLLHNIALTLTPQFDSLI